MMSDYNPHLAELRVVRLGQRQLRDDGAGQVRGDALHLAPAQCTVERQTEIREDFTITVWPRPHLVLVLVYSPLLSTTGVPKVFWIFSVSAASSGMSSAKLMMVSVESKSRRGASSDSSRWVVAASSSSSAEVEVSGTMRWCS